MPDSLRLHAYVDELTLCADELPLLTVQASLPALEGRGSRRFNRYYQSLADAFVRTCRTRLFPDAEALYRQALTTAAPLPQWHAELRTVFTCRTDALVSLYTDALITGTPHRRLFRRADTWDLRSGLLLSLREFFPPHTPCRRRLLTTAQAQIEREESQGISLYREDWHSRLRTAFHPHRFYLTDDGLCFFYPMYAIAPAAEGIPTFSLPYDAQNGPFPPIP